MLLFLFFLGKPFGFLKYVIIMIFVDTGVSQSLNVSNLKFCFSGIQLIISQVVFQLR